MNKTLCQKGSSLLFELIAGTYPLNKQNQFFINDVMFQIKNRYNINKSITRQYLRISMLNGKKQDFNLHHVDYETFIFLNKVQPSNNNYLDSFVFLLKITHHENNLSLITLQPYKLDTFNRLNVFEEAHIDW